MPSKQFDIVDAFENYKGVVFSVQNDFNFWKPFLKMSIDEYQARVIKPNEIYSSVFVSYDISANSMMGQLTLYQSSNSIETKDLESQSKLFFSWITNSAILKCYNALEILLQQTIWLKYFPSMSNPATERRHSRNLDSKVSKYLLANNVSKDSKNNRYLIDFLKSNSANFEMFIDQQVRIDLATTWKQFFEFLSILRNVIAHQGGVVGIDSQNTIKSVAPDIFNRLFSLVEDSVGIRYLKAKDEGLLTLLNYTNDFAVNSIKFLYNQPNLNFIGLRSAI